MMIDPLLHKEIQTHPQRKRKTELERLQLQQHYLNRTCEAILPPVLRRRKKKSEEDGGVGNEEREKGEHSRNWFHKKQIVWGFSSLWVFAFRNGGKVWRVVSH